MTLDELRDAQIDQIGRRLTDLIRKCRDPREIDGLLVAKDRLNRMKAQGRDCVSHSEVGATALRPRPEPPEGGPHGRPGCP